MLHPTSIALCAPFSTADASFPPCRAPHHPSNFGLPDRTGAFQQGVHCSRPVGRPFPLFQLRNHDSGCSAAKLNILYTLSTWSTPLGFGGAWKVHHLIYLTGDVRHIPTGCGVRIAGAYAAGPCAEYPAQMVAIAAGPPLRSPATSSGDVTHPHFNRLFRGLMSSRRPSHRPADVIAPVWRCHCRPERTLSESVHWLRPVEGRFTLVSACPRPALRLPDQTQTPVHPRYCADALRFGGACKGLPFTPPHEGFRALLARTIDDAHLHRQASRSATSPRPTAEDEGGG